LRHLRISLRAIYSFLSFSSPLLPSLNTIDAETSLRIGAPLLDTSVTRAALYDSDDAPSRYCAVVDTRQSALRITTLTSAVIPEMILLLLHAYICDIYLRGGKD